MEDERNTMVLLISEKKRNEQSLQRFSISMIGWFVTFTDNLSPESFVLSEYNNYR